MRDAFPKLWLGLAGIAMLLTKFHWAPTVMFIVGAPWFYYIHIRLKEVHFDGESIFIKDGSDMVPVAMSLVCKGVHRSLALGGTYRINFKEVTKFGKSILFIPRSKQILFKHQACSEFLDVANT